MPTAATDSTATDSTAADRRSGSWRGGATVLRVMLRAGVTRGRAAAVTGLGALSVLIVVLLRIAGVDSLAQSTVGLIANWGLGVHLPLVALLFGSSMLGDLRDDRTLVYLWLTPLPGWAAALAAWAASVIVVVPAAVVPLVVAAYAGGVASGVTWTGVAFATVVGAAAYCGVFVAASLLLSRTLAWGLAYIIVWEGVVAATGRGPAFYALRTYTLSIMHADLPAEWFASGGRASDLPAPSSATLVLGIVTVAALVVAAVRYRRMTVD